MPHHNVAGAHLVTQVPVAHTEATVGDTKKDIFKNIHDYKTINYVYLLSKNNTLVGVASFRQLLQKGDKLKLGEIAVKNVIVSHPKVNVERIAHLAIKHNIKAVPIIDEENHFVGVVSDDAILEILYKEHRRRFYKSAGIVTPVDFIEDTLSENIIESFLHRIPWVMIGLVGGLLIARIVGVFEGILQQSLVLAAFIPLIVYISAAVGAQTQTLFIRDLVINHKLPLIKYALKQLAVSFLIAICCSAFIWAVVFLFWNSAFLGTIIALASFLAIASSTVLALAVPYTLNLFKQDPANGSGPFATILQDLTSIVIYFAVATLLL
jgi:magnesium transporter